MDPTLGMKRLKDLTPEEVKSLGLKKSYNDGGCEDCGRIDIPRYYDESDPIYPQFLCIKCVLKKHRKLFAPCDIIMALLISAMVSLVTQEVYQSLIVSLVVFIIFFVEITLILFYISWVMPHGHNRGLLKEWEQETVNDFLERYSPPKKERLADYLQRVKYERE